MRHLYLAFIIVATSVFAQNDPDYYNLAVQAYAKKDYKTYLENLQQLEKANVSHPHLIHMIAGGYALNNKPDETLKHLSRIGEMGLYYQIESNPDFQSFIKAPQYKLFKKKYGELNVKVNKSQSGFIIREKDLIPEGIAYDPIDSAFFVGSLYKSKIVRINSKGKVEDFKASGEDALFPVIGMKVDPKKRILWVCSSAFDVNQDSIRLSGVFKFDLETRKLIKRYMVSKHGEDHFLNDLVIASSGDVYVSDSHGGGIYTIPTATDEIVEVKLEKKFYYPNGITISPDDKHLFLASWNDGITRINLKEKSLYNLTSPPKTSLLGVDGLYLVNNSLFAVQNGIEPARIVRFDLNTDYSAVTQVTILESNNSLFDMPTTGAPAGSYFYYIANSHLRNLDKGHLVKQEKLRDVHILRVGLQRN